MNVLIRQNQTRVSGAAAAFFCFSLFLTAYTTKHPEIGRISGGLITRLTAPVLGLTSHYSRSISRFRNRYIVLGAVERENEILRVKADENLALKAKFSELMIENNKLRAVLKMSENTSVDGIGAVVIGYDPSNWVEAIVVNRGTTDGVEVGMPVINAKGVVGQVMAASAHASRVLLITDHNSGIDCLLQSSRNRGVVQGLGQGRTALQFVVHDVEVKTGDRVVSSGMDGIYPKGLLIGLVSSVKTGYQGMFQSIDIVPVVDFAQLEQVLIITKVQERAVKELAEGEKILTEAVNIKVASAPFAVPPTATPTKAPAVVTPAPKPVKKSSANSRVR